MIGIYAIRNITNNKIYIGQSLDVEDRIWHHKSALKHNRHENDHLQKSWNKYGATSFQFQILAICEEKELDDQERFYIRYYNSIDGDYGYNNESGGSLHKRMSDESKRKMSESKKGMYAGSKNPMYGVHLKWTEERRKRLSEQMSGKNNPMYGVHLKPSAEQLKRASERFKGNNNPFYGHKHTEASKNKMRNNNHRKKPIRCVETGEEYVSSCEAGRVTGFDSSHIIACCNGKQKTAYGYHWEFIV